MNSSISLILLSGGSGSRIGSPIPKQYIPISGIPLVLHSLKTLSSIPEIDEIVIVCENSYQGLFSTLKSPLFASPGKSRQQSVKNGFLALSGKNSGVLIHDGARPFVKKEDVIKLIETGRRVNAATLANKITSTIKKANGHLVQETLQREHLWEIQTPQYLSYNLLKTGILYAEKENITVTDDVSFAELLNHPVELVEASRSNIKITTEYDLQIAKSGAFL